MRKFKRIFLLTFMALVCSFSNAQRSLDSSFESRIKNLEEYKGNVEQLYNINAEKLTKYIDEEVRKKSSDIDEAKKILNWLLYLGLPATILAIVGLYYNAVRKTKKLIQERIENIVEHKREEFVKLIETQEYDTKLKNTKKLLVLSSNGISNEKIKVLFSKLKFKNVIYRVVTEYAAFNDSDLVIFNNEDGSFSQAIIDDYITNTPDEDISFVAYTNVNLTRNSRINFSNSPFTLYHSVLSTLKYTEILKIV